jgi:hypothetical protein
MKPLLLILAIVVGFSAFGQSAPYRALKGKFKGHEDVFAFSANGLVARTALKLAGERDFRKGIQYIRSIRIISIPKSAFEREHVTVKGFRKVIAAHSFEEMLAIKDHGDDVMIYMQEGKKKRDNRYLVLVDDKEDVVALEIRGYIDPRALRQHSDLNANPSVK